MPAAGFVGRAGWPLAWFFAHKIGATDTERISEAVASLSASFSTKSTN